MTRAKTATECMSDSSGPETTAVVRVYQCESDRIALKLVIDFWPHDVAVVRATGWNSFGDSKRMSNPGVFVRDMDSMVFPLMAELVRFVGGPALLVYSAATPKRTVIGCIKYLEAYKNGEFYVAVRVQSY